MSRLGECYSGTPVLAHELAFPLSVSYVAHLRKFDCGDFGFPFLI